MTENNFEEQILMKYFEEEQLKFIYCVAPIKSIRDSILKYLKEKKESLYGILSKPEEIEINKSFSEEKKTKFLGKCFMTMLSSTWSIYIKPIQKIVY